VNEGKHASAPLRLAAMISGGGRTVLNLQDAIERGTLPDVEIALVIASKSDAPGVERLRVRGLDVHGVQRRDFADDAAHHHAIARLIEGANVDLVCLCGYLRPFRVDPGWHGRVINIHPALLPRHGGKGYYGHKVHEAVLAAGDRESGCTVHFVDDEYDQGPVILQRRCPVLPGDTPDTLAARVFEQECIAYPEAINLMAQGRVQLKDGKVCIRPSVPAE